MHTTEIDGVTFHHHGDYSGEIVIQVGKKELTVSTKALVGLVAEMVRAERTIKLEESTPEEILGINPL